MSSTPTPSSATLGGDIRRFPGAPRLGLWERGLAFSTCRTASPYPQPLLQAIRSWPFPVALFSVGPFLLSQGPFLPRRDCPRPRGGFSFSLHTPPLGLTLGCWWPFSTTAFPGPTLSLYLFFCSFFLLSAALWTEPRTNLSIVCLFLPPIPSPGLGPFFPLLLTLGQEALISPASLSARERSKVLGAPSSGAGIGRSGPGESESGGTGSLLPCGSYLVGCV